MENNRITPAQLLLLSTKPLKEVRRIAEKIKNPAISSLLNLYIKTGDRDILKKGAAVLLETELVERRFSSYRKTAFFNLVGSLIMAQLVLSYMAPLIGADTTLLRYYLAVLGAIWMYLETKDREKTIAVLLLMLIISAFAGRFLL